ncbi:threonylcarbamoyl-AMP synthase [Paracoccus sediminis]|uniref:Threonylcarbamoyl-AMP synthase n=1 Tax=Paracoccus sediminis TaxID=1214787 RepID=A0A238W0B3_9RHOB|nr:L-threonylcarbamoyladenylate synthase [Paracoccus sediminis]TBN51435.1 threonylcarbamoyl-AMP synthase [Paracoccus sediminis]SNR39583.1 translation factor SUA5 [Paracoccus sediminis]
MHTERLSPDDSGLARAASLLARGQVVAIPTETVYGLAGDARDGQAVARIYEAKGRPSFNPLIVHVADGNAARAIADMTPQAEALAAAFWPGALTLVLPLRANAGIASLVTAGLSTIALRIPAHPVAQALLRRTGPLAAPSANASGRISPTRADHVLDPDGGLDGRIGAVLDAGPCPVGLESTIVGWPDGRAALLRPGGLPAEAIADVLGQPLADHHADPAVPNAPGQLTSHYAPNAVLRLNADSPAPGETHIAFGAPGPFTLTETGDLAQAAARLFDTLRRADRLGHPIAVAPIPDHGLGAAINDRLRRAAAPRD